MIEISSPRPKNVPIPHLLWAILAIVIPILAGPAHGQVTSQRIAAVVNDDIITTQDLLERIELAVIASGLPDDPEAKRRIAPQALRGLIDETLQLQEAKRLNVSVADDEIAQAFGTVAERNGMLPEQLRAFLSQRGLSSDVLARQLRAQVAWIKVVRSRLRSKVVVTNEQVALAAKSGPAGEEQVRLAEIVLPVYSPEQESEVQRDARELVAAVTEGASFEELARQFSVAPSATAGGDIGWVPASALVPELQSIVSQLEEGEVSEPIRTPAGMHLIQLRDRRIASSASAVDASPEEVRQRLEEEQLQRLANRYLRDLRRSAYIDIRL